MSTIKLIIKKYLGKQATHKYEYFSMRLSDLVQQVVGTDTYYEVNGTDTL